MLQPSERRRAARWALGAFGTMALVLGLIWLFGRGHLPPYEMRVRNQSFVWPVVSTAIGLAAFAVLVVTEQRTKDKDSNWRGLRWLTFGIVGSLLICQTVFLIVDDGPIPSSSSTPYQPTAGVINLQRVVGSSLVGLGDNKSGFGGLQLGICAERKYRFSVSTNSPNTTRSPPCRTSTSGRARIGHRRELLSSILSFRVSPAPRLPDATDLLCARASRCGGPIGKYLRGAHRE